MRWIFEFWLPDERWPAAGVKAEALTAASLGRDQQAFGRSYRPSLAESLRESESLIGRHWLGLKQDANLAAQVRKGGSLCLREPRRPHTVPARAILHALARVATSGWLG